MQTLDLIDRLSNDLKRVTPLPPPTSRVALWLVTSLLYVGAVVLVAGLRLDLFQKAQEPRYLVELGAALATSILSAIAAFNSVSPGRPVWLAVAPFLMLAAWLGSLGEGCWQAWLAAGADGLRIVPDWYCFPAIVAGSIVPTLLIVAMLRRGSPGSPAFSMALAVLAATSLGAAALRLFHTQDASLMLMVWQLGTVGLLTVSAAFLGRPFLPPLEVRAAKARQALSGDRHPHL